MDNKIDLDAIINSNPMTSILSPVHKDRVKLLMKEAIHQALVLASEKAQIAYSHKHSTKYQRAHHEDIGDHTIWVDKQSILGIENLIV